MPCIGTDLARAAAALPAHGLWPEELAVAGCATENFLTFILRKRQAELMSSAQLWVITHTVAAKHFAK